MKRLAGIAALALAVVASGSVHAADDFYKGKKVRLVVSSTPGGGNDTYSRLIARHISRHIPGNPTIIVQNMPGAGGLMAADYLYRKAPRDGTLFEQINWGVWFWQVIGDKRARFDFEKMNAVGVAAIESAILFTHKKEFPDWDSVMAADKLITSGNSGPQSLGHTMGKVMEKMVGKKIFDYVFGYPGARQYSLAFRQGEVQSSGNTPGSFRDQLGDMWDDGKVAMLAQAPTPEGKRTKEFPDTPTLLEYAKTDKDRELIKATFLLTHYGRPYSLPPGVPKERVEILRKAFTATMSDPKFLDEARKLKRVIIPSTGAQLQQLWKDVLNAPPENKAIIKEIFGKK